MDATLLKAQSVGFAPQSIVWRRDLLVLGLVLLIAGFVRLVQPEIIAYHQDQADLAGLAQNLVEGKSIPLLGIPSSARLPNSPVTAYVVAIPFLFSSDPVFVTAFIGLMNVIGVGLLWFLARRYLGARVALIASLAYAVNPWAVGYSRSIWAQDYHTPIFLAGLLLGLYGFIEGKRWAQVLCLPVLVIAMQIHFAAWLYAPMYLWLVWVGRSRLFKTGLVVSVVLAGLTMLPYVMGVMQALSTDPTLITSIQTQSRSISLRELIKPYGYMAWLSTGLGTETYVARGIETEMLAATGVPTVIWVLLGGFTLAGVPAWLEYRPRWFTVLMLLWIFLPLVVLTVPFIAVFPHYFVPTLPALALMTAMGAVWLIDKLTAKQMLVRPVVLMTLAVIFLTQGVFAVRAREFLDDHYTPSQFGYGPSIHYLYDVQDALRSYDDVVLLNSGDWHDLSTSGAAVWSSLLRGSAECVRELFAAQNLAVLPNGPFAAVFTPRTPEGTVFDHLYKIGEARAFDLRPGEGRYLIYDVQQSLQWGSTLTSIEPAAFANGPELTAYALDVGLVTLQWRLPAAHPREYSYAVAFLNADGVMLDQYTAAFWPARNWCAGDNLVSWLNVTVPDSATALSVGMYDAAGDLIPVLNPAGDRFVISISELE